MDKVREEFEHWIQSETAFDTFKTNYAMTKPENQQYMCHHTNLAWFAWKASRERIVVSLPLSTTNYWHEEVCEALDKVGVRYE